ncbi:putative PurR-regulated permease PerM [Microbacterium proteolyticum]|uniref:Putative PurR-regulated permease PerM n=1 Tax=Microbacterium proteolyticum TaxID=1572644 RepID=A0A7W5CH20_9MICO|nr:AI-2E family transporter [Microbacterium proteolyticum]MBB3157492.1 putative PurR-regulated permease PerM [Microbacterium proteolyticum]
MSRSTRPDPAAEGAEAGASTSRDKPVWSAIARPYAAGFFLTLGGLTAFLLALTLGSLSTVLIYIGIALFIALALDPLVRMLVKRGLSRAWSILIVFGGLALVLAGALWLLIPPVVRQVEQFVGDIPSFVNDLIDSDAVRWVEANFGDSLGDILQEVQNFATNPANIAAIGGGLLQVGITIGTFISGAIVVLVLSLYFLASLPKMKNSLVRLTPARSRATVSDMTGQITDSVGGYLAGMVVLALCNAVFAFIVLTILQQPFAALLAALAFAITLIPLVGSVLFWATATVFTLLVDPTVGLIFALVYLVYMQIEAYLLTPRVMNRTISVPGSLVVIGALVGGTILGLLGALVAIPVTASVLLIIKQIVIPRQDAKK